MKKLYIAILVLTACAHSSANCQFKLAPLALSGISTIRPFKLPPVAKFPVARTNGVGGAVTDAVCTNTSCSAVLPVTLLQLTGFRLNNNEVSLSWKTENETNSKGFIIERSLDNAVTFISVGNTASDTSASVEKNYGATDMNSYPATSFYRVEQLDIDGNFTYSNIIGITGYSLEQKIGLTPNPANNYTLLSCFATTNGKSMVTLLSANGQKLKEIPWILAAGGNTLQVPLAGYAAGFYYVQLSLPDGSRPVVKLVVR